MVEKVIIDADPGIGDALAIAVALAVPDLDVLAVTSTAGSVSASDAARNLQAIIDRLDPPKWPRIGSGAESITEVPPVDSPLSIRLNGRSGLGDLELRVAELHHRHQSAKLICDLVRDHPHEVTLLTLGPLTNIELMHERAPDVPSLIKGLVILGGTVSAPGDVTPVAEFNIYGHPDAARSTLRLSTPKTLIPLDVSEAVVLSFDAFHQLPESQSRLGNFVQELLPFSFRAHHQHLGLEGIGLREIAALAALAQPGFFEFQPMAVDVETAGELTRGMTIFDRRGTHHWQENVNVATTVDAERVVTWMQDLISRCAW